MRKPRLKMRGLPCYYHLYNRIAGYPGEYPFTDLDKEKGFELLQQVCRYSLVEPIAISWLGSHFHIVAYAPAVEDFPDLTWIAARHNAYCEGRRRLPVDPADLDACRKVRDDMVDISYFIGVYEACFARYFNDMHGRRGSLWEDRFKNTILDGDSALWTCAKYVELNAMRAGLVDDPAHYRFCSWGRHAGGGRHPFAANFLRHMRRRLGERGEALSDLAVFTQFRVELARSIANERGLDGEDIQAAMDDAQPEQNLPLRLLRRARFWTDSAIIGSKRFVCEVTAHFVGPERLPEQRLAGGTDASGGDLYWLHRLRGDTL